MNWFREKKDCPVCRNPCDSSKIRLDAIPDQIILDLPVKCNRSACIWTGKNAQLKKHNESCKAPRDAPDIYEVEDSKSQSSNSVSGYPIPSLFNISGGISNTVPLIVPGNPLFSLFPPYLMSNPVTSQRTQELTLCSYSALFYQT